MKFVTDVDLLNNKVLIYDREGKYKGGSIANFAAEEGANVELASPLWSVYEDLAEMQKSF